VPASYKSRNKEEANTLTGEKKEKKKNSEIKYIFLQFREGVRRIKQNTNDTTTHTQTHKSDALH
jgi:hypothetical protein